MASLPAPVRNTHGISLPPRYTIRPINAALAPWAKALMVHGFLLRPSVWQPLVPEPKIANALRSFTAIDGHLSHAINSGLSYAIIDSEYEFRRPGSSTSGGALYWDELDPGDHNFERTGVDKMVDGMDFPMVCVAISADGFDKKPDEATEALYEFMPLVRSLGTHLSSRARESGETWEPATSGELLIRSGCVTKPGYERRGLMAALNHFVMLEAKAKGYKAISVGVGNPSVYRNWMEPPPGVRSTVVANVDLWNLELEDEDGRLVRPYVHSGMSQQAWLIWCDLHA